MNRSLPLLIALLSTAMQAQADDVAMDTGARTVDRSQALVSASPASEVSAGRVAAGRADIESIIVSATRAAPTSLPSMIPTTMEGVTREEIARTITALDSEDAIRYMPSLLVRKRYVGDYNHAVLSSRASGTGNSARSAVYADGILLSNYLGNGATYAPRWMLVTPSEIERVDVMYGPFSAAYPGNSVGAVVDYVTRMPADFETHVRGIHQEQPFRLYGTDETFHADQQSASVGDRYGNVSWLLSLDHTRSHGQPLTFPTKLVSAGVAGTSGTPVTGAVSGRDRANNPWYLIGSATEYTTDQDHAKLKLAWDISSAVRASYLFGWWKNDSDGEPATYLRNGAGEPVYTGTVNIDGRAFSLAAGDFPITEENLVHTMHGLSIKRHDGDTWRWEVAASLYDYVADEQRTPTVAYPTAVNGGAGVRTDQDGTGWYNLALKGTWLPLGPGGEHVVDVGYQRDVYELRILRQNLGNWRSGGAIGLNTDVGGHTHTQSVYLQDVWSPDDAWKAVLGVRLEHWQASGGYTRTASSRLDYDERDHTWWSPKAALAWQAAPGTSVKASIGRAVRMPTVNELYGATLGTLTVINDPTLRPEKSWTSELSLVQDIGLASLRLTAFYEVVTDSLYSERTVVGTSIVSRVTNVNEIRTPGVELYVNGSDLFTDGLDLSLSVTYADSRIHENDGFVSVVGDTEDKFQPRVPKWRATALIDYRVNERLNIAYGARYSGRQFSTLDNSDRNGFAYQGASKYFTTDLRVRYEFLPNWTAALGVDNLNNYKYWNFHPYPQRSYTFEVHWDM